MDLWKSLSGMLVVELTSASVEAALDAISKQNIPIFQVQSLSDLTIRFSLQRKDHAALLRLCEKRGETLHTVQKRGMFWPLRRVLARPVLLGSILLLLSSALLLPKHIFFVRVEGNSTVPTNRIIEAAEECGVSFGVSRKAVRSERVKNALLSAVPELQWAGVNTRGCVAVISVRERTPAEEKTAEKAVSSIVAIRDGVILSCTATRGNLVCGEGQAVKEGELLISGYTDCGISIQATCAQGEILAQTARKLRAVTPAEWLSRGEATDTGYCVSLLVGKKRINLWKDSGIWDATCGRMYKEYYMTLPGGFRLPLALCIETFTASEMEPIQLTSETAEASFRVFTDRYLKEQMVAGEILRKDASVTEAEGIFLLEGNYICREMIGRVQPEEIGEYNGKTGRTDRER